MLANPLGPLAGAAAPPARPPQSHDPPHRSHLAARRTAEGKLLIPGFLGYTPLGEFRAGE